MWKRIPEKKPYLQKLIDKLVQLWSKQVGIWQDQNYLIWANFSLLPTWASTLLLIDKKPFWIYLSKPLAFTNPKANNVIRKHLMPTEKLTVQRDKSPSPWMEMVGMMAEIASWLRAHILNHKQEVGKTNWK